MPNTMLISVGGASAPVIHSIKENKPDKVIFFVSRGSLPQIGKEVIPAVCAANGSFPPHLCVVTPDEQDLGVSIKALLTDVPRAMRDFGIELEPWPGMVDYTGGTKTMSAAVVWASARHSCQMSYIGSRKAASGDEAGRTKDGLGIVQNGYEFRFLRENPWNTLAHFELADAMILFDKGLYGQTAATLSEAARRVSHDRRRRLLKLIGDVAGVYHKWDLFEYKTAGKGMERALPALKEMAEAGDPDIQNLKAFADSVDATASTLARLNERSLSWEVVYDLLANASRRAEFDMRYDDALIRCYAAIEKAARHQLLKNYGIDNSKCQPERVHESVRSEYQRKYSTIDKNGAAMLSFGLAASYELLRLMGDPMGVRFFAVPNLQAKLTERNLSMLAHGVKTVTPEMFESLFQDAREVIGVKEESLTKFPRFGANRKDKEAWSGLCSQ